MPSMYIFSSAEIHLGGGRYRPVPDDANSTAIDYMLCMDFKGSIPRTIVNAVMSKMMLADASLNRQHVMKLIANANSGK